MKADYIKILGQSIRFVRLEKEISQEALAHKCGFHRTYIGSIERGERCPSVKTLLLISDALDIPITKLLADLD